MESHSKQNNSHDLRISKETFSVCISRKLNDEDLALLYDLNTSKNRDSFDLDAVSKDDAYAEFRFLKNDFTEAVVQRCSIKISQKSQENI